MPQELLNEREFELVNIVGAQLGVNQRDISRQLRVSLGMTNMLLRRLIAKGYIRINQLNKRKIQYLLTPKGFSEKLRKSVKYTIKTINSIGVIKNRLKGIFQKLYQEGERNFYIFGSSDLGLLAEIVIREISKGDHTIAFIQTLEEAKKDGIVCMCKEGFEDFAWDGQKGINLITELAQGETSFIIQ